MGQELDSRITFRSPEWIEEYLSQTADQSGWASESQVARDMMEMGIIFSNLVQNGEIEWLSDSWERPQGEHPGNDELVCPNCVSSNRYLFRYRNRPMMNIEAIECLSCGHVDEADEYLAELDETRHYWAQSGPHPHWHIVDEDARRTLCGRYNSDGLNSGLAPGIDGRPTDICPECWFDLIGVEYELE